MDIIQKLQKARDAKTKVKKIFNSDAYSITIIPMNYKIDIKLQRAPFCKTIDRDFYTDLDCGKEHAHEVAKWVIDKFFIKKDS